MLDQIWEQTQTCASALSCQIWVIVTGWGLWEGVSALLRASRRSHNLSARLRSANVIKSFARTYFVLPKVARLPRVGSFLAGINSSCYHDLRHRRHIVCARTPALLRTARSRWNRISCQGILIEMIPIMNVDHNWTSSAELAILRCSGLPYHIFAFERSWAIRAIIIAHVYIPLLQRESILSLNIAMVLCPVLVMRMQDARSSRPITRTMVCEASQLWIVKPAVKLRELSSPIIWG